MTQLTFCVCVVCVCVCVPKSMIMNNADLKEMIQDFPGSSLVKNLPANVVDTGSVPGLGSFTCRGETKLICHDY